MDKITDEVMENVEILAKLDLSPQERKKAAQEMEKMLSYIEKLNELETESVEPMPYVVSVENVFREDVVTNKDRAEEMLANAPAKKDGQYQVPKTIGG